MKSKPSTPKKVTSKSSTGCRIIDKSDNMGDRSANKSGTVIAKRSSCNEPGKIIDTEPKPTRPKHPNAADNFWSSHQAEYEDRAQAPNRCKDVHSHNDAFPKLKDELDKKRDISQPMICQTTQIRLCRGIRCGTQTFVCARDWTGQSCIMCSQRRYSRRRYRKPSRARRNKKYQNARISKSRRRHAPNRAQNRTLKASDAPNVDQPKSQTSKSDVGSLQYPSSSRTSRTSYYSFKSMGEEPMVE